MAPELFPGSVNNKYTEREPEPFAELPEPLAMWRRLADTDPNLFNTSHPLHPFAKALFEQDWSASVVQIAKDTGKEPDHIRGLVRKVLIGSFKLNEEKDIISLVMPEESSQQPLTEEQVKTLFYHEQSI